MALSRTINNRYADIRNAARVKELALFVTRRTPSELELQARWFAGDFGREFVSNSGDKIDIVQFGTWNREAGPDFRDGAISINGADPVRGAIEIDLLDRNWELHGHATNPMFEETVLHVFLEKSDREFFSRTQSNRNVPQVRIDLAALPDAYSANLPLARPGRCCAPLRGLPTERVENVLASAAQFRLKRKAARLRAKIDSHGIDEALFQEIAAALGYKENRLPFELIAQRVPLKSLREKSTDAEALLFGIAGFLASSDLTIYKEPVREYVRRLWDNWWPNRDAMLRLVLPADVWRITSTRPSNHPQRRLAALGVIAQKWPAFRDSLGKANIKAVRAFFEKLDHPFWQRHYTLAAAASPREMSLVGASRVVEILANVLFPYWQNQSVDLATEYSKLPALLTNRRLETGAMRLFGDDPRRKNFLKTVVHQQGLLQIYEDFCLQDNSDCAQCPFPEQMQKWK